MGSVINIRSLKCITWILKASECDRMYVSEPFMYQNCLCNLLFCADRDLISFDVTKRLSFRSKEELLRPTNVTVCVSADSGVLSVQTTRCVKGGTATTIWTNKNTCQILLTMEVFFHADVLMEDKSIQTGSYLNANVSAESLPDDFSKLLETGSNHDAEIKCGEHSLNVHKVVLCARSEVFKTMMKSDFMEGHTGILQIHDMDSRYFQDFVHYLYTGWMPELTLVKAKVLYEAGDKYAVRNLMTRCSEYLQDNLSEENLLEFFVLGDAHSDQELKDAIKTFILENKVYLEDEYWEPFCEKFSQFANEVYRLSYKKKKN